jgi:hypothetical protein
MANSVCGLTIIKRFSYRGDVNEEWSNHYQFSGATPADAAAWRTLFDALVLQEKTLYAPPNAVIAGYGYDRTPKKGDHALWAVDLRVPPNSVVPGTLVPGLGNPMPGDSAVWIRWGLDRFNAKGKRVYLRKYFHPAYAQNVFPDNVITEQRTALTAFAAKMMDGSFAGGRTIVSPPDKNGDHGGMVPVNSAVSAFVTTRTLKRRGKRPPTSAP